MSTQIQRRRGIKTENEAFTGAEGEFVYETDTHRAVTHDGSRQGGYPLPNFEDVQNQAFNFTDAAGTATAITCSTDVNPDALVAGLKITLKMDSDVTGASTLQWGSLAATNVKLLSEGVKSDTEAGTWFADDYVDFIYDGVDFIALVSGGSLNINGQTDETITAVDELVFSDVSDGDTLKKDTVQGILDLAAPSTSRGAVGTYGLMIFVIGFLSGGSTTSGSNLRFSQWDSSAGQFEGTGAIASGTWRHFGTVNMNTNDVGLFLRIS